MKTTIKKWGINAEGIGYLHHKPVFIKGALPDEVVSFMLEKEMPRYSIGHLQSILKESPRRRKSPCAYADQCDGCALMHVDYKGQCQMKMQILKQTLAKYAGYRGKINPLIKNESVLGYRNSCKMPVKQVDGKIRLGMYKAESNTFVSIPRCIVHQKGLEQTRQMLESIFNTYSMQAYDFQAESGLRTVVIKEFEEKIQVILVTGQDILDAAMLKEISQLEHVVSLWQSMKTDNSVDIYGKEMRLLYGQETMELHLDDLVLQLLPRSFFQLNTRQAYRLYHYVKDLIQPCDVLVEAYSGIGAMSLMLAKKAKKVIGIEYIEDAVKNANENAQRNHLKHVSFVCEDAGKALRDMKETIDALVVDPPRTGLDALMKEVILKKQPNQIVYVSCNPSTLAKDLKQLQEIYQIKSVQPFDMFSQTQHIESVVLLTKTHKKKCEKGLK